MIQFTGVYAVNPQTSSQTPGACGTLPSQQRHADAGGLATVNISPPIILAQTRAPRSAIPPAPPAPLLFTGTANTTYAQNLYFHKNAFTVAIVPMVMPESRAMPAGPAMTTLGPHSDCGKIA